jgi:hypothetical protein
LDKYQDGMPFPVIGDPDKTLYHRFGVLASAKAVFNPHAWRALPVGWRRAIANAVAHRRGHVAGVKYGTHAYDQWSVDELLVLAQSFRRVTLRGQRCRLVESQRS